MILLLAGTTEGRKKAVALKKAGIELIVSTATSYGEELLRRDFEGEISATPLDKEGLLKMVNERKIEKIIDATHPFALEISSTARNVCHKAGIVYERVERESFAAGELAGVISVDSATTAARIGARFKGKIFLTTGSRTLERYAAHIEPNRLVVRIIPIAESLEKCLRLNIPHANIIAMQGPFSETLNREMMLHYNAEVIITKDSGASGGTLEKIRAAQSLEIPVIVISRPKLES